MATPGLQPGLILADIYHLEELLGKGGMGEVWLASHFILEEKRAIKVILGEFAANPLVRERFIRGEARNALRLQHPNIVRVYDLGQHRGMPYIVMEYIASGPQGADLKSLLKAEGKLTLTRTGEILNQLAAALDHAHSLGLVHRDLKPANILMSAQGQVKLSDFGLVKDLKAPDENLTIAGFAVGTPAYMSPDQAQGEALVAGDIYSLGVVVYEMLAGQPPFLGSTVSLIVQHATTPPAPLHQFNPAIPPEISDVILKALAKNPKQRYSSVIEFAQAFQNALSISQQAADAHTQLPGSLPTFTTRSNNLPPDMSIKPTILPVSVKFPTIIPTGPTPHNLPSDLTSFVGRGRELTQIVRLLTDTTANNRLVTLTGPGGTGKTRLAIQAAEQTLNSFPGGVWLVELASLTNPALAATTLANTLGLVEQPNKPILSTIIEYLKERRVLLVLDSCEHLIEAAAQLVESLLRACPYLQILTTSREIFSIPGEASFRVPSLSLPETISPTGDSLSPEALLQYEAVILFVERARATNPGFSLTEQNAAAVAHICRRLDGIPLALELAAARIKILSAGQINERLDDRFKLLTGGSRTALPRQQTLRAMIDWSYELLPAGEQMLLQRLAIFPGSWNLLAAKEICSDEGVEDFEVLDSLTQMVNKSLVIAENSESETRFRMLESIRQYGQEKLDTSKETAFFKEKHANYYLNMVEEAEPELRGEKQATWLASFEREKANLQAAITPATDKAPTRQQVEIALRISGVLWFFWFNRGYSSEGLYFLEKALANTELFNDDPILPAVRAKALKAAGTLAFEAGKLEVARSYSEESLEIMRQLGDKAGVARLLSNLAVFARAQRDFKATRPLIEESLAIFRELNDKYFIARTLNNLGLFLRDQGEYADARARLEEALTILRLVGGESDVANTLSSLGDIALDLGDLEAASKYLTESLAISQRMNNPRAIAYLLDYFAGLAAGRNNPVAVELAGAAARIRADLKIISPLPEVAALERRLAIFKTFMSEEEWDGSYKNGYSLSLAQAISVALKI